MRKFGLPIHANARLPGTMISSHSISGLAIRFVRSVKLHLEQVQAPSRQHPLSLVPLIFFAVLEGRVSPG